MFHHASLCMAPEPGSMLARASALSSRGLFCHATRTENNRMTASDNRNGGFYHNAAVSRPTSVPLDAKSPKSARQPRGINQ